MVRILNEMEVCLGDDGNVVVTSSSSTPPPDPISSRPSPPRSHSSNATAEGSNHHHDDDPKGLKFNNNNNNNAITFCGDSVNSSPHVSPTKETVDGDSSRKNSIPLTASPSSDSDAESSSCLRSRADSEEVDEEELEVSVVVSSEDKNSSGKVPIIVIEELPPNEEDSVVAEEIVTAEANSPTSSEKGSISNDNDDGGGGSCDLSSYPKDTTDVLTNDEDADPCGGGGGGDAQEVKSTAVPSIVISESAEDVSKDDETLTGAIPSPPEETRVEEKDSMMPPPEEEEGEADADADVTICDTKEEIVQLEAKQASENQISEEESNKIVVDSGPGDVVPEESTKETIPPLPEEGGKEGEDKVTSSSTESISSSSVASSSVVPASSAAPSTRSSSSLSSSSYSGSGGGNRYRSHHPPPHGHHHLHHHHHQQQSHLFHLAAAAASHHHHHHSGPHPIVFPFPFPSAAAAAAAVANSLLNQVQQQQQQQQVPFSTAGMTQVPVPQPGHLVGAHFTTSSGGIPTSTYSQPHKIISGQQQQQKYQHYHQQQQQHQHHPPPQQQQHQQHYHQLNGGQGLAMQMQMQLGYYGGGGQEQQEIQIPFPSSALHPLEFLNGSATTTATVPPLPTAIIPLPLDTNFPPIVMPSYPGVGVGSGATSTQSTSGYSTAGHSRSSSPMGPTTSTTGLCQQQQQYDNGLLPIPPSTSTSAGGANGSLNFILAAASSDLLMYPQFLPSMVGQFVVYFHINPGVSVSFTVGEQTQVVKGPMTVPLVSTNSSAPIPLPMQVPPGHVVQQIVDENGTLRHVIVSHQPPLIPIPNYNPNSQGQQFYPAGPSGYPNAHFTQMQPGVVPCPVPSPHQGQGQGGQGMATGYTTGGAQIPVHVQKDERTQRQFMKLRRKFEQKQTTGGSGGGSFNSNNYGHGGQSSVRKDPASSYASSNGSSTRSGGKVSNGVSKSPGGGANNGNGGMEEDGSVGSTGSVTSTGTQDEEEEHRSCALTEMLSSIIPATVTEVTARSAYVQWGHPDRITEAGENRFPDFDVSDNDFRYEVFINDKVQDTREGRFRSIFVGSSLSCRVKDLKPGSLYAITYCSVLGDVKGNTCIPTNFTTLPAEPDPPSSPRAVGRSRSTIQLKWNPPLNDNGAKINLFILEYDEGKGGNHFVEAYRGKNKQCTVSKLQPAYSYQFRLAAVNDCGKSRYTNVINAMTAGSPPSQPSPPTVAEAGVKYLRLEWKARDTDEEYTLQMEDPSTGHGFLPVYNGSAPNDLLIGLQRNSQYKFRLRAQNEEGHSSWSEEVVICTLPDRPGPPHKPTLKGRVHAYGFKVRWEPPSDNGGVPVQAFALEIDQGNGYEEIYRGSETECTVDRLSPGQSYALRVIAIGPGGGSDPSESCVITTEPVCPGQSHIPRIVGKPKSNSVHLKWSPPDWTGGSPINMYEVGCTTPDNLTQEAYRGKETECIVNRLLPGRAYLFQIRAFNRIGAGEWSDPLEVISGAGAPDAPSAPRVLTKTSHIVLLSWTEPLNNGSAISEYKVQMASPAPPSPPSPIPPTTPDSGSEEGEEMEKSEILEQQQQQPLPSSPQQQQPSSFTQVYVGSTSSCEVKGLQPASPYLFRVQATNSAGTSDWSPVVMHEMPASSPNGVSGVEAVVTSSSISLSWKVPVDNGSAITHYNVMVGESLLVALSNTHVLDNLMPDTQYKIRVQAVNTVGPGAFSTPLKLWTKPLAPPPPKLECVSVAHFWMKLRWTEIVSKNIEYLVQMINPYKDEFEVVYRGTASNCKVTRLSEDTEYQFRICALNGAGQGPFSELFRFGTAKAPPPQIKGCKSELLKDSNIHRFEWLEVTCNDTIEYQLQVASKKRDMDFKTIYRGTDRRVEISHDQLEEGVDYACRVCAIRVASDGIQLVGPYSNNLNFHIPLASEAEDFATSSSSSSSSKTHSTSSKSQTIIPNSFYVTFEEKMSKISYESRVGIVAVFALIILAFVISLITHHVVS